MTEETKLYTIRRDVECLECGNIGAIKFYGTYRNKTDDISHAVGFGGTVPHICMNCKNTGLIDFGGLEGYKKAFKKVIDLQQPN